MVKNQILSVGLLIAAVLFAVGSFFVPLALPISLLASCLCCTFSVMLSPSLPIIGVGVLLAFTGGWLALGSASASMVFLIFFLSIGISLGIGLRNKNKFNDAIGVVVLSAVVLGTLTFFVYIGEASGGTFDVESVLKPLFDETELALKSFFAVNDPAVNEIFSQYGLSAEQYIETFFRSGIMLIPTFYIGVILLVAVVCFWVTKSIMLRTEEPVSFMGSFDDFSISRTFLWVYFACYLLYFITGDSVLGIVFSNFYNTITFVFTYSGLSLISYLLGYKNVPKGVKKLLVGIAIFACLIHGFSNLISIVGVLDNFVDIRRILASRDV